jgi:5-methyltetrahydropteroyltriglutamate--homocysteine methyltransferase
LHLFLIPLESANGDSQMIFVLPNDTPFAASAKRRGRTRQFARITKTAGGTRPFIAWAALSPVARNRPQTRFARAPSPLHRQHSLETFENGHLQGTFAGTARGTRAGNMRVTLATPRARRVTCAPRRPAGIIAARSPAKQSSGSSEFKGEEFMLKSTEHILTTHTGSLPRGAELNDLLIADEAGEKVDQAKLTDMIEKRVAHVMEKQRWSGVNVANDGEQGRVGFQTYVPKRMHGFGGESKRPFGKEWLENPLFTAKFSARIPKTGKVFGCPECVSELKYHDKEAIKTEIARFKKAAATIKPPFAEMFFAEPSPGIIATTMLNAHYSSYEGYLDAIAREMHYEYKSVVDAGYVLQIDAPDLAMERVLLFQDKTEAEYVKIVELHIATLNKALHDIPRDRVRLHICWGNWEGPHIYDIGLEPLLHAFYQANVGALSIEFANARRQHEYAAVKKHKFPDNMILIPGVIDSKINLVEHPEVVAQRIESAVAAVGDRERVIAGVDCGFGTFAGWEWVAEDVVWLKLKTLREGADIATKRLWGKKAAA